MTKTKLLEAVRTVGTGSRLLIGNDRPWVSNTYWAVPLETWPYTWLFTELLGSVPATGCWDLVAPKGEPALVERLPGAAGPPMGQIIPAGWDDPACQVMAVRAELDGVPVHDKEGAPMYYVPSKDGPNLEGVNMRFAEVVTGPEVPVAVSRGLDGKPLSPMTVWRSKPRKGFLSPGTALWPLSEGEAVGLLMPVRVRGR